MITTIATAALLTAATFAPATSAPADTETTTTTSAEVAVLVDDRTCADYLTLVDEHPEAAATGVDGWTLLDTWVIVNYEETRGTRLTPEARASFVDLLHAC